MGNKKPKTSALARRAERPVELSQDQVEAMIAGGKRAKAVFKLLTAQPRPRIVRETPRDRSALRPITLDENEFAALAKSARRSRGIRDRLKQAAQRDVQSREAKERTQAASEGDAQEYPAKKPSAAD